jgi:hypothetical protein
MSANDARKTAQQIHVDKAQARRDAADRLSRDVAEARQQALAVDAVKTARLRALRLAKQAEAVAQPPSKPPGRRDSKQTGGSRPHR